MQNRFQITYREELVGHGPAAYESRAFQTSNERTGANETCLIISVTFGKENSSNSCKVSQGFHRKLVKIITRAAFQEPAPFTLATSNTLRSLMIREFPSQSFKTS